MASRIAGWRSQTLTNAWASAVWSVLIWIVVVNTTKSVDNTTINDRYRKIMGGARRHVVMEICKGEHGRGPEGDLRVGLYESSDRCDGTDRQF